MAIRWGCPECRQSPWGLCRCTPKSPAWADINPLFNQNHQQLLALHNTIPLPTRVPSSLNPQRPHPTPAPFYPLFSDPLGSDCGVGEGHTSPPTTYPSPFVTLCLFTWSPGRLSLLDNREPLETGTLSALLVNSSFSALPHPYLPPDTSPVPGTSSVPGGILLN